jgi:hypothetical protein
LGLVGVGGWLLGLLSEGSQAQEGGGEAEKIKERGFFRSGGHLGIIARDRGVGELVLFYRK